MSWFGALVTFLITWWLVLFAVLPTGVRGQHEDADGMVAGQEPGAPQDSQMGRKVKLTTIIALGIFAVIFAIVHFELISLDQFAVLSQEKPE